ncbi:MAG: MoaD/ThiS family protein [Clostridia bacterium]|nr:MoaD/ThiS family protein [Clostridia bacterium]
MVKVKLFGLFRLDTGIKEMEAEASCVKELYPLLLEEAKRKNPAAKVTAKEIEGCIILINGKAAKKNSPLKGGDEVMLMSPVCGG